MAGRILVIDAIATNRIVLKVKLGAACYDIQQSSSLNGALALIHSFKPDLILAGTSTPQHGVEVARAIKAADPSGTLPLILTSEPMGTKERLHLLSLGVDDVLIRPLDEVFLLARIRSLLRAHEVTQELRRREGTTRALGFAEQNMPFTPPARIGLVTSDLARAAIWRRDLEAEMAVEIEVFAPSAALGQYDTSSAPDAMVLAQGRDDSDGEVLSALPELRARAGSRHAAVVAIVSEGQRKNAVMALDLGANDVLTNGFEARELALRLKAQLRHKRDADRLRATLEDGLKMAVTDPLTGLYNRRYAMPHLAAMVEQADVSGRQFAVILADLDRFKLVNDRYGHGAGDLVLIEVANRFRDNLRGIDLISRIGGEEFLIAMPDTSQQEALFAAERLRRLMKNMPITLPSTDIDLQVTMSIGVAMGPIDHPQDTATEETVSGLIKAADTALYASKNDGRDQVTFSLSAA